MGSRRRWAIGFLTVFFLAALYGVAGAIYWRGIGSGTPLQDPMIYYNQYIYPRAWTRSQLAPGVPEPIPFAAVYGPNVVGQSFRSSADRLSMLRVWLGAARGQEVYVSLRAGLDRADTIHTASLTLQQDGYYDVVFPPLLDSAGKTYVLFVEAPQAEAQRAVALRVVPTERVGGVPRLNEYAASGNIDLSTYHRGLPGRWMIDALAEQVLPRTAALRLQQYKPAFLKGDTFGWLLAISVLATVAWALLTWPAGKRSIERRGIYAGSIVVCVAGVVAALCTGIISWPRRSTSVRPGAVQVPEAPQGPKLAADLLLDLYPADRDPERRFFATAWAEIDGVRQPCVAVPPDSSLRFHLRTPIESTLHLGLALASPGTRRFQVLAGDGRALLNRDLIGPGGISAEIDLSPYGGQEMTLTLLTSSEGHGEEQTAGLWCSPQIASTHSWLLPDPLPADVNLHRQPTVFGEDLELLGYHVDRPEARPGDVVTVTLYWRALRRVTTSDTVFVHLLDETGRVVGQHDDQPVFGTYPTSAWSPGDVIADRHPLSLPGDVAPGDYLIEVGLYDLATLLRRPALTPEATLLPGARLLLDRPLTVVE